MIDTPRHEFFDLASLRRAFAVADPDGEAALNWLLYASAALLMSAVLLVTTSPSLMGIALAIVPWIVLTMAGWLWISPAVRGQMAVDHQRRRQEAHARALAADILLDETTSRDQRRAAAAVMLGPSD